MSEPDYSTLFSRQAGAYAQFRPTYPPAWFEFLAGLFTEHDTVLDCATGSGQAVSGLAGHFRRLFAIDASQAQLTHRQNYPNVIYLAARSEWLPFAAASFDLLTAAQAAHWFDMDRFNPEARRVVRRGGVVALWCYEMLTVNPAVDAVVDRLYHDIAGPYWSPRRRIIEEHYTSLPFPFDELPAPALDIEASWTLENLVGYLNSWSAAQEFIRARGFNPLTLVQADLLSAWEDPSQQRLVRFPIYARVGRV